MTLGLHLLKDERGSVERVLRAVLDRIGVDPYDVRIASLRSLPQKERETRMPGGSPCYHVKAIDYTVHVWLPAALAERHPRLALQLRKTSPRWGVQIPQRMV